VWARNLLFLGLVGGGLAVLAANLFPPAVPPRAQDFDPARDREPDFQALVGQVNAAFRREWEYNKLRPAGRAPDLTVARRLALALTGTIPSLQEIRQLEARPAPDRLAWWLEGIFPDRRYADYVAERLARAFVGTEDGPFLIFRRRRLVSWLSDQLWQNRPYDEIVRELITADGLWTDRPAVNFLTVTVDPGDGNRPNANRLAGRVCRAFLGVRLDCAQCHDHPFERRWKQKTFQGLAAFFGQTGLSLTGIHDGGPEFLIENRKTGRRERVAPAVPFYPELLSANGLRRQRLARWVTHPANAYFARAAVNRVWALLFGRPLVEPVDDPHAAGEWPAALDLLAADFARHGFDLRRLIRAIAATEAFRQGSAAAHELTEEHEAHGAAFPLTRLRPEQVAGGVLQAASLTTVNSQSHIFVKLMRYFAERDFVQRYGDTGEDEFAGRGGTIPQRLLLMNGDLVKDKTQPGLFNAATRIGWLAPDDPTAIEAACLAVLTRRPTAAETRHFQARLAGTTGERRGRRMEDLFWALVNSTEFAWNH
jgi:hypothetical protein